MAQLIQQAKSNVRNAKCFCRAVTGQGRRGIDETGAGNEGPEGARMKVAIVVSSLRTPAAGLRSADSEYGWRLAAALTARGHDVTVHAEDERPTHRHTGSGSPHWDAEDVSSLGDFVGRLDASWTAEPPEVIHAHSWRMGLAAQLAADRQALPTVMSFHSIGAPDPRGGSAMTKLRIETLLARTVTWAVAGSADRHEILARLRRSRDRMSIIPGGVDSAVFTPSDGAYQPRRGHRILGVSSAPAHQHGFEPVLRAMTRLPDAEFVGATAEFGGGEVASLRVLARGLGISSRTRFVVAPSAAEFSALLHSADVVTCTPSAIVAETAVLQAMACGLPVVATSVGAVGDAVVHDVTGFLVPPGNSVELVATLKLLLAQPFRRQGMGAAGRSRACSRYSWHRLAIETQLVYERALQAGATKSTVAG